MKLQDVIKVSQKNEGTEVSSKYHYFPIDLMKLKDISVSVKNEVTEDISSKFHNLPISYGEMCQETIKGIDYEKSSCQEDEMNWQEPEVLIRLEDPLEDAVLEKLFVCHHCTFEWNNLNVLRSHIESVHIPTLESEVNSQNHEEDNTSLLLIDSQQLDIPFTTGHTIQEHLNFPGKKKKYIECPNCDFICAKDKTLKKHSHLKHNIRKPNECPSCKFSTHYMKVLRRHIVTRHPNIKPYCCTMCPFSSYEESELNIHRISQHTDKVLHSCPHCNYVSGQCNSLMKHIKSRHPTERLLHCQQCNIGPLYFNRIAEKHIKDNIYDIKLKKEKNTEVFGKMIRSVGKIHECTDCDYKTPQLAHLKRHIISNHTLERPYQCGDCSYSTARSDHLRKHVINKHGHGNTYYCDICYFSASHASGLKLHKRMIHSENNICESNRLGSDDQQHSEFMSFNYLNTFMCSHCDYVTRRQDNLNRHLLARHTNVKCYQCQFCAFRTYRLDTLNRHLNARHFTDMNF